MITCDKCWGRGCFGGPEDVYAAMRECETCQGRGEVPHPDPYVFKKCVGCEEVFALRASILTCPDCLTVTLEED